MEQTRTIAQQQPSPGRETPLPVQINPGGATPVYGSSQPAFGMAGRLRGMAYSRPQHHPTHWLLLLAADRLESSAALIEAAMTPGRRGAVPRHFGRQARAFPRGFALAAAILGGMLAWLTTRRRSAPRPHARR
jgi:hypothetical protein